VSPKPTHSPADPDAGPLTRRRLFAGAGVAGAAVAVASMLPAAKTQAPAVASAEPAAGAGYRLTEHVRRYYQTARI
jgi:hypothetical protein